MLYRSTEHVRVALEIGSCFLLAGVWGIIRHKRLRKESSLLDYSRAHAIQLQQKDLLIREVHHRVANQMGLTAAFLHLQASCSVHPTAKAHLFESENRIRTLSKLHAKLHQTDAPSQIFLYPYLSELAQDLINSLRPDIQFCAEFSSDSPSTKSSTAVTCGLLVHELITNCIKHAFSQNQGGTIRLTLERPQCSSIRISIHDNGVGLPEGFTLENPTTSGMAIINALTKDLAGTFSAIQHLSGTEFITEFPLPSTEMIAKRAFLC